MFGPYIPIHTHRYPCVAWKSALAGSSIASKGQDSTFGPTPRTVSGRLTVCTRFWTLGWPAHTHQRIDLEEFCRFPNVFAIKRSDLRFFSPWITSGKGFHTLTPTKRVDPRCVCAGNGVDKEVNEQFLPFCNNIYPYVPSGNINIAMENHHC